MMFFLCLLISLVSAGPVSLETGEYSPYSGESIPAQGLSTQVVKAIFKEMNQDMSLKFLPWSRIMIHLKKGEIAGSFPWVLTDDRASFMFYSDPIHLYRTLLFVNKDMIVKDLDLNGKKFCQPMGWGNTFYSKLSKKYKVEIVHPVNVESCMRMLQLKRTDLVIMDEYVGNDVLKQIYGKNSPIVGVSSKEFPQVASSILWQNNALYFVIPKKYPEAEKLMQKFNLGLKKIKKNGVYAKIMESYLKKESAISTCVLCNQLGSL